MRYTWWCLQHNKPIIREEVEAYIREHLNETPEERAKEIRRVYRNEE
jgi:hypothetical protein